MLLKKLLLLESNNNKRMLSMLIDLCWLIGTGELEVPSTVGHSLDWPQRCSATTSVALLVEVTVLFPANNPKKKVYACLIYTI